ncbi:MAG TPA: PP2C family protein-serine/threonine phosphatase [Thermoanaerobaculia bacterium]|nr:PP2C family protein-serine/threonine phosphatase [Thermoanaerobaculia bacterium]
MQVQKTIAVLETSEDARTTISSVADTIASSFQDELGITGGRLFEYRDDGTYQLVHRFGENTSGQLGIIVPRDYRPLEKALENGAVVMDRTDQGIDPILEQELGAERFAAISVGDEDFILSFNVAAELSREDILFSLNLIRYSINQKLRADKYQTVLAEAQRIQQSILPHRMPNYEGYDIYGRTVPAEIISGDFYDFIPVTDSIVGLAIADGTGHGLPAALVVRDIYMGLRMGVDRDFKIVRTIQKLNHIIHRNKLTTKFVSLFYGELESVGTFIYTNAGHNPPFLLKGDNYELLTAGGMVLGPTPDASYTRGYVKVEPGDILCLYTDGIVEANDGDEQEFGLERLKEIVRKNRGASSQEIVGLVLHAVDAWGPPGQDDRTIVIVKAVWERVDSRQ